MILFLLLGLGVETALGESSSVADSDDSPSTINARWLKSKSAARDISYSSSFGSEDFDSPDIPSNFHARWGINKTWGARTPHPILSRRVSFEDYGKVPPSPDSFDEESPEEQQSTSSEHEVKENANSRTTLSPNPLTSNKNLNEKIHQTTLKKTITSQTKAPSSSGKQKPTLQVKAVGTTRSRKSKEKVPKATQVPTQLPTAMIQTETPSLDGNLKETDMRKTESPKYLSSTAALTTRTTSPPPVVDRANTHSTAHSTLGTTSSFMNQATTAGQEFSTLPPLSTTGISQFKTRGWDPFPKMDRSKKRRGVIVLKPPPEDWPEPDTPEGAKPPPSEFGATLPPMGTFIDTRLGRKGKGYAASFANPPYLGHRKIDFVPQFDKAAASDGEPSPTVIPSMKWRIRGRRDRKGATGLRQKGGGYLNEMGQEPGFRKDLTMKPPISRYYIAENTTFLVPTVRNTRPYQRSYFNFRMRYPMNVGRAFGPPEPPPYGQPPPPPHYAPNNPYGQPPYPQFPQSPYPPFPPPPLPPPYGPPPPYGQRPPPPPAFIQGIPHPYRRGPPPPPPPYIQPPPPPPPYDPHSPPPPEGFEPPLDPIPESAPPPSPYPTGPDLPPVHPFLDGIPTISPIDKGPAPWPRRQVPPEFRPPQPRVPEFLRQEPRNFSGYKGPRRGRAYEQFGKADLRPRHTKFFDEFAVRGTPRFPIRKGSGFGVEFQTDITGPPEVLGDYFAKRTWPTRSNKYGYEPYRRSDDRKRPYGFGRYAVQRPPILGDFGDYRPYKRVDDSAFVSYNFSRPTRSYTFPPRLRLAIKNASYYRRSFRRTGFQPFNLPTLPSIGLAAYLAQNHDYYGNPVTLKGRITNLEDLKAMFTWAPTEEAVEVTTIVEKEKKPVKPRLTAKPKGMTAREAMRAAAREAIKEAEMENWEARDRGGRRRGWRRVGGSGGGRGAFIRRGGARGSGMSPRNFRRAKRSLEEEVEWLKRFRLLQQKLETSGNYMTGPDPLWAGSQERRHSRVSSAPPLRMHRWRSKGRPPRRG